MTDKPYSCMDGAEGQAAFEALDDYVDTSKLSADSLVVVEAARVCSRCVRVDDCRTDTERWLAGRETRQIDIRDMPNVIGGQFLTQNGTRSAALVQLGVNEHALEHSSPDEPIATQDELKEPTFDDTETEPEDEAIDSEHGSEVEDTEGLEADETEESIDSPQDADERDTAEVPEIPEGYERYRQVVIINGERRELSLNSLALLHFLASNRDHKVVRADFIRAEVLGSRAKDEYASPLVQFMKDLGDVVDKVGAKSTGGYVLRAEHEIMITKEYKIRPIREQRAPIHKAVKIEEPPKTELPTTAFPAEPTEEELRALELELKNSPSVLLIKPTRTKSPKTTKPISDEKRRPTRARGTEEDDIIKLYMNDIGSHELLTKEDEVRLGRVMEQAANAKIILEARGDGLDFAERRRLQRLVSQGERAERTFIESNLRLVVSIAKRYQATGMPLLDLIQEGNIGMMHAVEKFDYRKGFKFSTYATWWIRQAITRGVANTGRMIRLPVHAVDTLVRVQKARGRLEMKFGRAPTIEEIASDLALEPGKVAEVLRYGGEPLSLDEPLREGADADLGSLIADRNLPAPEEEGLREIVSKEVEKMLHVLDTREQEVLKLRFGFDRSEPRTLDEVGEYFNLTRERIRQIEARAMSKLRHPVTGARARGLV